MESHGARYTPVENDGKTRSRAWKRDGSNNDGQESPIIAYD